MGGKGPLHLEVLLQALLERVGYLVELVELPDALHGRVVPGGARVQPLDYGRDVAKYAGVHEGCILRRGEGRKEKESLSMR